MSSPHTTSVRDALVEFIGRELMSDPRGAGPGFEDDLLGSGIVDSLGVMSLVYFVEQTFGFEVPPEDVTVDNFLSVETLTRYIVGRLP